MGYKRRWYRFVGKNSDIESYVKDILSKHTLLNGLFGTVLSSSLKEVRFTEQKFSTGILISNIKYNHIRLQNNNPFYPFYN